MGYWLFKTEPDEFGISDLAAKGTARWDGIRNYQARNFLRDEIKVGDGVLIYHSSCTKPGVVGTAKVVQAAYPDPAQFDASSAYYDPKATAEKPRWYCVDITFGEQFKTVLALGEIKQHTALHDMVLLKQGRLSVQPVRPQEWRTVLQLLR